MTKAVREPEVVVIGAGPAGSAAALALARGGAKVVVCEQAVFPRRKVCGGCLSGDAVARLGGMLGDGAAQLGTPVQRITFHIGRHSFSARESGRCRIVPRDALDLTLANAAGAAGAHVRFGVRAQVIALSPGRLAVRVGDEQYDPPWIVWAAGPANPDPFRHRDNGAVPPRSRRLIGQVLSMAPARGCPAVGEVSMHWLRGGYVGLATVSAEQCLVAWAAEAEMVAGRRPWEALRAVNDDSWLVRNLLVDAGAGLLATAGFPIRPANTGWDNLLLAGDAAGFEEPFSGEGIGQALRSGQAAGQAILTGGTKEAVQRNYVRLLGEHRRIRRRTRWLSTALRHPITRALLDSPLPIPAEVGQRILARVHIKGTA